MKHLTKRIGAAALAASLAASLAGCGGSGNANQVEPGVANTNTDQTEFSIISGISALSGGYDDNPVLNEMPKTPVSPSSGRR